MDHGCAPGTIYTNPTAINMDEPYPSGVGSNCPCYNIDPLQSAVAFPTAIKNIITAPFYPLQSTIHNPIKQFWTSGGNQFENTSFNYNQNYAHSRVAIAGGSTTVVPPPIFKDENQMIYEICDKRIDNGPFKNLPWELMNNFPSVPNTDLWYSFKINEILS